MNTLCRFFFFITCLALSTGYAFLPTDAIARQTDSLIKEPKEVPSPRDMDKLLPSVSLEYGKDNKKTIYERFSGVSAALLVSIQNVIAKNQDLINQDPVTGNYCFKGFLPPFAIE